MPPVQKAFQRASTCDRMEPVIMDRSIGTPPMDGRGKTRAARGVATNDDQGGVANRREYVQGSNPRQSTAPAALPVGSNLPGSFVFTFIRLHSSAADSVQAFQYSPNLTEWIVVPVVGGGMVSIQPNARISTNAGGKAPSALSQSRRHLGVEPESSDAPCWTTSFSSRRRV